jgi:mRNA interferase MazF
MITNAARPEWPGDVAIENAEALGLLIPSKVRTSKIASAETASAIRLGRLDDDMVARVLDHVRAHLPL